MPHETELIATLAFGLSAAFIGGLIAERLRLPALVGYLLAGVAVGPFTPGLTADTELAQQLAEVGVILLMFGVGMHFSPADLLNARKIALPGAVGQIAIATGLGVLVALAWGWTFGEGLVFGLALSVASTVVLLRALEARDAVQSEGGKVAVGWLVVEDLAMVIALVLLPALASTLGGTPEHASDRPLWAELAITLGKLVLFVGLMLIAGVRVVPWILDRVSRTGSRELTILATLAGSLGLAYAAGEIFGVSYALGAFLAGVVFNESPFGHQAAEEALPLREAFAVLFFVSVGMLIDPRDLLDQADRIAIVVAIITLGKAAAAIALARLFGGSWQVALTVAAGLGQIGEFSFILMDMGTGLDLLPESGRELILAGALFSITLNPLLWRVLDSLIERLDDTPEPDPVPA